MGIAALVIGIISIIVGFVPALGVIALFPAFVGLILGIVDTVRKSKAGLPKGQAIAGIVLNALAIVFIIFWVFVIGAVSKGVSEKREEQRTPKKVESVATSESSDTESSGTSETADASSEDSEAEEEAVKNSEFKVGDVVEYEGFRIKFISAKPYKSRNMFMKPKRKNQFYRLFFEFENISDENQSVSYLMGWECFADGYSCDQKYFSSQEELDGDLKPGTKTKGPIFFEVPKNAKEITVDYADNVFDDESSVTFRVK